MVRRVLACSDGVPKGVGWHNGKACVGMLRQSPTWRRGWLNGKAYVSMLKKRPESHRERRGEKKSKKRGKEMIIFSPQRC